MKTATLIALASCLVFLAVRPAVAQAQRGPHRVTSETRSGPFPLTSENVVAGYGTVVSGLAPLPTAPSSLLPSAGPATAYSQYQPQRVVSPLMGLSQFTPNFRADSYYRFREQQQFNREQQQLDQEFRTASQVRQRRIEELSRRERVQFDVLHRSAALRGTQLEVTKLRQAGTEVPDAVIDEMTEQANNILKELEEERNRRERERWDR